MGRMLTSNLKNVDLKKYLLNLKTMFRCCSDKRTIIKIIFLLFAVLYSLNFIFWGGRISANGFCLFH